MREFPTGATRDDVEGKLSYMRALSPEVLRRYVEYLAKHREQADGQMRDWDNWKAGIPIDTYMDSLVRHTLDTWLIFNCQETYENVSFEDLLCAIVFNAMGCLYELMMGEPEEGEDQPQPITDPRRVLSEVSSAEQPNNTLCPLCADKLRKTDDGEILELCDECSVTFGSTDV